MKASLSLVKESVNHRHSDLPTESMPRNTIFTVASDCEDMVGNCTALRAFLSLHGNEEALSRCSALWNLCRSLRIHLYKCAFTTRDDSAVSDQFSEACAILKRVGTLAGEIGKMME
jgi:hypothetical protein